MGSWKDSTLLIASDNSFRKDLWRIHCWIYSKITRKNVLMFLTFPHYSMEAEIVEERVNCGGSCGLEIPVPYHFLGPEKAIEKIQTVKKEISEIKKLVKIKFYSFKLFVCFFCYVVVFPSQNFYSRLKKGICF